MKLTEIWIYPIKSCQGISLSSAELTAKGLTDSQQPAFDDQIPSATFSDLALPAAFGDRAKHATFSDRNFMLVDSQGNFLTQRQYPQLATIKVSINGNNLILKSEDSTINPYEFCPRDNNSEMKVKVWRDHTIAIDQGDEVAKWFQSALNLDQSCRLVKQSENHIRAIDPKYSTKANQPVSFADGFPFLLTNTASVEELNRRLEEKYPQQNQQITMNRFRPNLVIETNEAFIEDTWQEISLGKIKFRLVKPCSRCLITTTDQKTGDRNSFKEPLATLSSFRTIPQQGIMFGQNLIALNHGIINVGDLVEIEK